MITNTLKVVLHNVLDEGVMDESMFDEIYESMLKHNITTLNSLFEHTDSRIAQKINAANPLTEFRVAAFFYRFVADTYGSVDLADKFFENGVYSFETLNGLDPDYIISQYDLNWSNGNRIVGLMSREKNNMLHKRLLANLMMTLSNSAYGGDDLSFYFMDNDYDYYDYERFIDMAFDSVEAQFDVINFLQKKLVEFVNRASQKFNITIELLMRSFNRILQFTNFVLKVYDRSLLIKLFSFNIFSFADVHERKAVHKFKHIFSSKKDFMQFRTRTLRASNLSQFGDKLSVGEITSSVAMALFVKELAPDVVYISSKSLPDEREWVNIQIPSPISESQIRRENVGPKFSNAQNAIMKSGSFVFGIDGAQIVESENTHNDLVFQIYFNRLDIREMRKCIDTGTRAVIPVALFFDGHANLLHLDGSRKIIEVWDPVYVQPTSFRATIIPLVLKEFFSLTLQTNFDITHYASNECINFHPQSDLGRSDAPGSCLTWTWWFAMVKAKYPYLTKEQMDTQFKDKWNKDEFIIELRKFFFENADIFNDAEAMVKLMKESPLFAIHNKICRNCDATSAIVVCGQCMRSTYCNQECANKDWTVHSKECAEINVLID